MKANHQYCYGYQAAASVPPSDAFDLEVDASCNHIVNCFCKNNQTIPVSVEARRKVHQNHVQLVRRYGCLAVACFVFVNSISTSQKMQTPVAHHHQHRQPHPQQQQLERETSNLHFLQGPEHDHERRDYAEAKEEYAMDHAHHQPPSNADRGPNTRRQEEVHEERRGDMAASAIERRKAERQQLRHEQRMMWYTTDVSHLFEAFMDLNLEEIRATTRPFFWYV
jgi:hypothetical protein